MPNNPQDNFQIFIALPTDGVCSVRGLSMEMFVYELKSRVELKAGIPGNIFCLFFMNVQLQDKETLKAYNLKNGCIVRVKIESSWISLFEACWHGDIFGVFENGVQFLDEGKFQGNNISLWNKLVIQRATFALFIACHRGYLGLILELINRAATDINGKTIFGRSALHAAAYQGFVGCVALLLSEGAIPNQVDIQGKTALALASKNGHVYCERRLWLYQWNLPTSARPPRSCSVGSSESNEDDGRPIGRYNRRPDAVMLSSATGTKEQPDLNNNYSNTHEQKEKINFQLPRYQINDGKRHLRRLTSHEPPQPPPKPSTLMKISEKYRKELREYTGEGTLNLPLRAQNRSFGENGRSQQVAQALVQEVTSRGEAGAVDKTCTLYEAEQKGLKRTNSSPGDTDISKEERGDSKTPVDHKKGQTKEERDTTKKNGMQYEDRPASGRTYGIRKLDILMSESRVGKLNVESSSPEQGEKLFDDTVRKETRRNEPPQEEGISLIDIQHEYCCRKPAQTFENWLQLKRNQEKNRPSTAPAPTAPVLRSKMGKAIDPESFKKWLNSKRHQRTHSNSESSSKTKKTFISYRGMTFDRWLKAKSVRRPCGGVNYVTESGDTSSWGNKLSKPIISGKPFELWLAEKKAMEQSIRDEENEKANKNNSRSGKTFEVWLQDKHKQQQIELVQKITTLKEQQRLAELDQLQKWLNPRYKTYEDWLEIKNQQAMLERVRTQAQNESDRQQDDFSAEEKQKDAKVVYDIWQTMKAVQEINDEEKKYKEMKAKWAAKEKKKTVKTSLIELSRRFNVKST